MQWVKGSTAQAKQLKPILNIDAEKPKPYNKRKLLEAVPIYLINDKPHDLESMFVSPGSDDWHGC